MYPYFQPLLLYQPVLVSGPLVPVFLPRFVQPAGQNPPSTIVHLPPYAPQLNWVPLRYQTSVGRGFPAPHTSVTSINNQRAPDNEKLESLNKNIDKERVSNRNEKKNESIKSVDLLAAHKRGETSKERKLSVRTNGSRTRKGFCKRCNVSVELRSMIEDSQAAHSTKEVSKRNDLKVSFNQTVLGFMNVDRVLEGCNKSDEKVQQLIKEDEVNDIEDSTKLEDVCEVFSKESFALTNSLRSEKNVTRCLSESELLVNPLVSNGFFS